MASGAARIQPRDSSGVGHALIESKCVVDMVNVAMANTDLSLDALWSKDRGVDDECAKPGTELLSDRKDVINILRFFSLPR